ncbi:WD domain, G-beta repeat protein (macronuclear) [Tetrahymena thermophila SB210]|uniref:WD domain, G-beta repeat protein n=1 Tax=Tetrahymena thermophila (strain SB210) TaxID=312017 RepID=Q22VW4_TETTS|nr:WD domain, G-beta repeat protein [Tetrahymena thermophila SB210]EAR89652.1 WD domain, G-beta repeat protein [Tetrahymena thermophila SB210]|eukprot:XP_001009898.1 WD domain, G-beta repeat protein [Tetrahymena thermophila SB210]
MYENSLNYEGNSLHNSIQSQNFDSTYFLPCSQNQFQGSYQGLNNPHHQIKKKDKANKDRDRYIGTINQRQYFNSLTFNIPKPTISKQKNQSKSHKTPIQNQLLYNLTYTNNQNTNHRRFQSPQNPRGTRSRPQQLQITQNNQTSQNPATALTPLQIEFSTVLSQTNLSVTTSQQQQNNFQSAQSYSSSNLQSSNLQIRTAQRISKSNYYSCTNMDQEDLYEEDSIIESKELQEELQNEQNYQYIQLLKKFEESPLSKNSPFFNRGCETAVKRKILNFSTNEISDDMKKVFSMHSLSNLNEQGSNFIYSTINETAEMVQHESICAKTNNTSNSRGNLQNYSMSQPPQLIGTIQLVENIIEDDFYQNILDWNRQMSIAAMAEKQIIHLTDFKTQQKDSLLSNSMQVCHIDYLPLFDKLLNQQIGCNNCNQTQSWSINSSTHFLSSQKKRNYRNSSSRYDTLQVLSSNSLQTHSLALQSLNNLNCIQNEETQSQNEETEISEISNQNDYEECKRNETSTKNSGLKDHVLENNTETEVDGQSINISCFNLNTPSPDNQEIKQQQSCNQLTNHINIQSFFPNPISPIIPNDKNFYSVLKFSPSGHILVAGRSDGVIEIFDVDKKQSIFVARCHSNIVTSISINKTFVATASKDSKVVIFDIKDLHNISLSAFLSSRNCSSILCLEWNPLSENTLAASTESGHINLYNILKDNKNAYKEFQLKLSSIKTFSWHPSKRGILLAGSLDGFLFVIDLEQKLIQQKKKILNHIYKIIFSPNQSDRFVCLTGHQPEINNSNNQIRSAISQSNLNNLQQNLSNQEIINDNLASQQGSMLVLSYPQINKIHHVSVGDKRACQGILSHDGSNIYTLTKENLLKQWKVFKEPQQESSSYSILSSAQELR